MREQDVCARKHKGNPQSEGAHQRVRGTKEDAYEKILSFIRFVGPSSSKEIAEAFGTGIHCVSPRLYEMKQRGMLAETGEKRLGAAVVRVVEDAERIQGRLF